MKKKISYIILIYTLLFLTMGCIRIDRSSCSEGALISFRYILNSDNSDKFNERVGQITLYVFDSEGLFFDEISKTVSSIQLNTMKVDLPTGTYSFVAVGGYLNYYTVGVEIGEAENAVFTTGLVYGESEISDFRVRAKAIDLDLIIDYGIDDLFMGIQKDVKVSDAEYVKSSIDLTLNVNAVNVTFKGLESLNYSPTLKCKNGIYNAENEVSNKIDVKYKPSEDSKTKSLNSSEGYYQFRSLRLVKGVPLYLMVEDEKGNIVIPSGKYDLLDYIMQSSSQYETQEGLDRVETYEDIELEFDENSILVSVAIGNWSIKPVKPEIE